MIKKKIQSKEFVGDYETKTRKIESYLYVTHTYSSDELKHYGIDHVYREEIFPIIDEMTKETVTDLTKKPKVKKSHKMNLIHGDDPLSFDRIRNGDSEFSVQAFQEWKIAKVQSNDKPKNVGYRFVSHVEDWASKSDSVYLSHDPVNLIWSDTVSGGSTLLSKVNTEMSGSGWNDLCVYSSDLYINIDGTWTAQDRHHIDNKSGVCNQFHLCVWEINSNLVIGSAHEENLRFKDPSDQLDIQHISASGPNYTEYNYPAFAFIAYHSLEGFDSAEDEAADEFTGGCWSSSKDSHDMGNMYTRKMIKNGVIEDIAYNDGYATVINCS